MGDWTGFAPYLGTPVLSRVTPVLSRVETYRDPVIWTPHGYH
jgi:hypothetical protein